MFLGKIVFPAENLWKKIKVLPWFCNQQQNIQKSCEKWNMVVFESIVIDSWTWFSRYLVSENPVRLPTAWLSKPFFKFPFASINQNQHHFHPSASIPDQIHLHRADGSQNSFHTQFFFFRLGVNTCSNLGYGPVFLETLCPSVSVSGISKAQEHCVERASQREEQKYHTKLVNRAGGVCKKKTKRFKQSVEKRGRSCSGSRNRELVRLNPDI